MKFAIGIVVDAVKIYGEQKPDAIYEYGVKLKEGVFLAKNGDEFFLDEDLGKPVIACYNPEDRFCEVIPTEKAMRVVEMWYYKTETLV